MSRSVAFVVGILALCASWLGVTEARAERDPGAERIAIAARTLGYVRYFHPSDQAHQSDWDSWAVEAAEAALSAPDHAAFEAALAELVGAVAPSAELGRWNEAQRAERAAALPPPASATSYRYWRHHGVAHAPRWISGGWVYRSDRLTRPLDDPAPEPAAPTPGERLVRPIADDLWLSLPLAVYADENGTLPTVPPSPSRQRVLDPDELPVRVAALMQTWALLRHFYPYFDTVGTDWEEELLPSAQAMLRTADRWEGLDVLAALVARLHDGHGSVTLGAMDPRFDAIPMHFDWAGDELVIVAAEGPDAPPAGSVVTAFNARPVMEEVAERARRISSATPGWTKARLINDLRFWMTDVVEVDFVAPDGARGVTRLETRPIGLTRPRPPRMGTPLSGEKIAPGVMYFDLSGATSGQLRRLLRDMARMDGVVLDLRGYPYSAGQRILLHLSDENVVSAWWRVPIVFRPGREAWDFGESRWDTPPRRPRIAGRVVFITDGSAISYAESVMGIVEKLRLGEIVGAPTAGSNGNVNPFAAAGGYQVVWTGMLVEKHDRTPHHGVGALPTVYATPTAAGIAQGRDELLEVAHALAEGRLKGPVLDGVEGPLRWDPQTNALTPAAHPTEHFGWPVPR